MADASPYGYMPTEWVGIFFVAIFGISTLVHLIQLGYYRNWTMIPILIGGIGEIIGWVGRLISSINIMSRDAYLTQISTLIIAPTFYQASVYMFVGKIASEAGKDYTRLKPFHYSVIFVVCDVVSLVVQAVGGGKASLADTLEEANKGANIMLAGIVFQFFCLVVFIILACEIAWRLYCASHSKGRFSKIEATESNRIQEFNKILRPLTLALIISILCLFVRGIYRIAELSEGWNGPILKNQNLFIVLDATLMFITQAIFNVIYPAITLSKITKRNQKESLEFQEKTPVSC